MIPITDFLLEFWQRHFFWVNTIAPVTLALLVFGSFLWKQRKATRGFFSGLATIVLLWVASEWWVYSGYLDCERRASVGDSAIHGASMCGEWVGIGMLIYAANALLDAVIFSGLAFGISLLYRNMASKIKAPPQTIQRRQVSLVIAVSFLILAAASVGGGYIGKQATDLIHGGFFVRWQPVNEPLEIVQKKFEAGDQKHAFTTWGVCSIEFHISSPPSEVVKSVEIMSCSAADKRLSKYVLLKDGSYWVWKHEINSDIAVSTDNIIAVTLGSISGFLCGSFLSIYIWKNRRGSR